jgi:hypothetical protein
LSNGGNVRIMMAPGMTPAGANTTPEQIAEAKRETLIGYKQDFTRLVARHVWLWIEYLSRDVRVRGHAESADGTADVLDVKGRWRVCGEAVRGREHAPAADAELDGQRAAGMQVGPGTAVREVAARARQGAAVRLIQFNNGGGVAALAGKNGPDAERHGRPG